jgi:hypothetical protein
MIFIFTWMSHFYVVSTPEGFSNLNLLQNRMSHTHTHTDEGNTCPPSSQDIEEPKSDMKVHSEINRP